MKNKNRELLIEMDRVLTFSFPLLVQVSVKDFGTFRKFEFPVPARADLQGFIYDLVNPFRHDPDWAITGDNYVMASFRPDWDNLPGKKVPHPDFVVVHSMKNGLKFDEMTAKLSNQFFATFKANLAP